MSTNFPTSLDALTNPSSTDSMATVSHSGQHANANDAIEALQAKVGVNSSAVTTSLDYRVAQLELGGGGGASVTVSDTAPASPTEGDLWFESDTGDIFVYYDSAWIDVGGSSVANISVSATAPSSGVVNGDLWFDTDTGKTYVYYDDGTSTQWVEIGATSAAANGVDGAIQFASGGTFASDANNLYWDDTNNRLGINTSSPTAQLDVYGGAKVSTTMTVGGNLTVDTSTLHVDSTNNRVGIGTTSPARPLHVEGTGGTYIAVTTDSTGESGILFGDDVQEYQGGVIYSALNNNLAIRSHNNITRMTIDSSGNVGINDTAPTNILQVWNGTYYPLICRNDWGIRSTGTYALTTSAGANIYISSNGTFYRSTSSGKYKTDVEDMDTDAADVVFALRPVWFRSTSPLDPEGWSYYGLIAEEVAEVDPRLVSFGAREDCGCDPDADHVAECLTEPEGVYYDRLVPHLISVVQRQQAQIDALTARIEALEAG